MRDEFNLHACLAGAPEDVEAFSFFKLGAQVGEPAPVLALGLNF